MSGDEKTPENQPPPTEDNQGHDPYANPFAMPGDPGDAAAPIPENTPPDPNQPAAEPQETLPQEPQAATETQPQETEAAPEQPQPQSRPDDPQVMTGEQPVTTLDMSGQTGSEAPEDSEAASQEAPEIAPPPAFEPPLPENPVPEHMRPEGDVQPEPPAPSADNTPPIPGRDAELPPSPEPMVDPVMPPVPEASPAEQPSAETVANAPAQPELPAEPEPISFMDEQPAAAELSSAQPSENRVEPPAEELAPMPEVEPVHTPQPESDSPSEALATSSWSTIESGGDEASEPQMEMPQPPEPAPVESVEPAAAQQPPPQPELPPAQPEQPPMQENAPPEPINPIVPPEPVPEQPAPPAAEPTQSVQELPGQLPEYGEMASPFSETAAGGEQPMATPEPPPEPEAVPPAAEQSGESQQEEASPFASASTDMPSPQPQPEAPVNQPSSVTDTMNAMPGSKSSWSDVEHGAQGQVPPVTDTMQQAPNAETPSQTVASPPPLQPQPQTSEPAPAAGPPPHPQHPSGAVPPQPAEPAPAGEGLSSSWSDVESGKDVQPEEIGQGIDPLAAASAATSNIDAGHGEGIASEQPPEPPSAPSRKPASKASPADDHQEDMPDFIAAKNDPNQQFAGFMSRFGAALIDGLIVNLLLVVITVGLVMMIGPDGGEVIAGLLGLSLWLIYATLLEGGKYQATFGKRICGIKVVRSGGEKVSKGNAFVRNLMKIVSTIPLLLGYFMALFTRRKQALHDIIAKTEVHRYKKSKFWKFFIILFVLFLIASYAAYAVISSMIGDAIQGSVAPPPASKQRPIGAPPMAPPPPAIQAPDAPEQIDQPVNVPPPPAPVNQGMAVPPPPPAPVPGQSLEPPPPAPPAQLGGDMPPPLPGEDVGVPPLPGEPIAPPSPVPAEPIAPPPIVAPQPETQALPPAPPVNLPDDLFTSSGRPMDVPPLPYKVSAEQYEKILQSELVVFEGPYVFNAGPFALRLGQIRETGDQVQLPLLGRFSGLMNVESGKGGTVSVDINSVKDVAGNEVYAAESDFESGIFTEMELEPLPGGDVGGDRSIALNNAVELGNIGLVEGNVRLTLPVNVDVLQYRVNSMEDRFTPTAYNGVTISFEEQGMMRSVNVTLPPDMQDRIIGVVAYDERSQTIERNSVSSSNGVVTYGFDPDFDIRAIQVLVAGDLFKRSIPFTIQAP